MFRNIFYTLLLFLHTFWIQAQSAQQILEHGIRVDRDKKFFIALGSNKVQYDLRESQENLALRFDFIPLEDTTIFLIKKNSLNRYLTPPLNPLQFEHNSTITFEEELINKNVISLLEGWESQIQSIYSGPKSATQSASEDLNIINSIEVIKKELKNEQINEISDEFVNLKSLNFTRQDSTIEKFTRIRKKILEISYYFQHIKSKIEKVDSVVTKDYNAREKFIEKIVFTQIINEARQILEKSLLRYSALEKIMKIVEDAIKDAKSDSNVQWAIKLPSVDLEKNKITIVEDAFYESNFSISNEGIIKKSDSKLKIKKKTKFKKFNRFIPEISAGMILTSFIYNVYGTSSNSLGEQIVVLSNEEKLKNIKFSAMLNYNYYIENSSLHPFYQLGVAFNNTIPTLATGFGLRINNGGLKRLALSIGIATTFLKDLEKLKVGDKISGSADIESDLTYDFIWPPKLYIGFQRNF